MNTRQAVDKFYKENGDCWAGCDWWRYYKSVLGECTKSAPVSSGDRVAMLGAKFNFDPGAGHIVTPRNHVCGDFIDSDKPQG